MKKNKIVCLILILAMLACSFISQASCAELTLGDFYASEDSYYFSKDENKIYMPFMRFSQKSIIVDEELNNMGAIFSNSNIEVNSAINKPVAIFANDSVRINSDVKSAVVFSTTNIIIDSNVEGDLILFGVNDITITENSVVTGDIICFGTNINVKGNIDGNLIGAADKVVVDGNISKDLRMEISDVEINNEELIGGEIYLESYGVRESIEGLKSKYPELINKVIEIEENNIKNTIYNSAVAIVTAWLLYILIKKVCKKDIFKSMLQKVEKYKTPTIIISAFSLVAIPLVLIVGFILIGFGISLVGVPLLIIYFALLFIAICVNLFVIGSLVSTFVLQKVDFKENKVAEIFASLGIFAALQILTVIPFISFISTLYVMFTMGVILVCVFGKNVNS